MGVIEIRVEEQAYGGPARAVADGVIRRLARTHEVRDAHAAPDLSVSLVTTAFGGAGVYVDAAAGDRSRALQEALRDALAGDLPVRVGEGSLPRLGHGPAAVVVELPRDVDADTLARDVDRGVSAYLAQQPYGGEIPLDPGAGGRSISPEALEVGDIIVSTTTDPISGAIRMFSGPVSHAMLYVGKDVMGKHYIAEAGGSGVVRYPLDQAIGGDETTLAVAFRHPTLDASPYAPKTSHPNVTPMLAFVDKHVAAKTPFNDALLLDHAKYQLSSAFCRLDADPVACRRRAAEVNLGRGTNDSFICSEFVLEAFRAGGLPLTRGSSRQATPSDIARAGLTVPTLATSPITTPLLYVGHLKA